jgi:hypothetical protein
MIPRAAFVACAFVFAQCVTREPRVDVRADETSATTDASSRADIAPDEALVRMSAVRELAIMRGVDHVALSRDALLAKVRAHVERAIPHAEIAREDAFLKGLGAIARSDDYERRVYDALRGALGGMYEPFDQTMYLPIDSEVNTVEHELTLAHESVHALQDQHFDLRAWEKYLPGASDEMDARACLAEGDASVASGESPTEEGAHDYVEREIAAPYIAGTAFVRALLARGGWAMVNRAWTRGGLTTEQILHPEKWFANETSERVPEPSIAALGPSFRATFDVEGELAVRLVLGAGIASGWAGDSSVVARDGDATAVAWRIRWDDEAGASHAMHTLAHHAADDCEIRPELSLLFARRARDVLILSGPPRADCALLARWAKEIFAS